jgi:EpsI family protein
MDRVTRFMPAALLGIGCALIFGVREQLKVPSRAPMRSVALDVAGYSTSEIPVAEEEQRIAGMTDYTLREFRRDSLDPGFSVYVGYYDYQQQGKTIHSPKNCLPGAGWEQVEAGVRTLRSRTGEAFVTNRYLLANKGAQALVYYWYQGRGRIEASEYRVKWHLLRDAAVHGRTEEALVRIVVPIDGRVGREAPQGAREHARADSIAVSVAAQLEAEVRRVMPLGPGAA